MAAEICYILGADMDTKDNRVAQGGQEGAQRSLPFRLKLLFSFALCVGLFGCIEAVMRLARYEPLPDLREIHTAFATGEGPFYPSRDAEGQRVFRRNAPDKILSSFRYESFPSRKPSGRVRVFCLGESTVYGSPFPEKTAFPSWLEDALRAACPSADVEVIGCGVPGVDSFGVMAVARLAMRDWRPDILALYTGHNELLMANRLRLRLRAGLDRSLTHRTLWLLRRSRLYLVLKKQLPLGRRMDAEADREVARLREL
ncbi:MAG: hypothetical protein FJ279_24535, partial [Planctomycetes bacterium]|nr:hypothetical protein [Planctomycetota bacterium]